MNDAEKIAVYTTALSKLNSDKINVIAAAMEEFSTILDYRDSEQRIAYCKEKITVLENAMKKKKSATRFAIVTGLCCIAVVVVVFLVRGVIESKKTRNSYIDHYNAATSYLDENRFQEAALEFGKAGDYEDAQERSMTLWRECVKPSVIAIGTFTGNNFIVGLKTDGTVVATGRNSDGQCDVSNWESIISVSAGFEHTVGLKSDGSVVAIGSNDYGQCNVSKWENIVQVVAGNQCTIGLQSDGRLLFAGDGEDDCINWEDIVEIWVEEDDVIGKSLDGRIISSYLDFSNNDDWKDLKKVSISFDCGVFGLTQDNTVIFDKWSHHPDDEPYYAALGLDDAQYWTDIIDIDGGLRNVVGIKRDGTVVFAGSNEEGQNDISDWKDIAVIATEGRQTIGVKSDGTVLLAGDIGSWGINVSQWNNIMLP